MRLMRITKVLIWTVALLLAAWVLTRGVALLERIDAALSPDMQVFFRAGLLGFAIAALVWMIIDLVGYDK